MAAIVLESDGSGWLGSFGVTVEAFAADLLSDGEPVSDVTATTDDGVTISGVLTEASGGYLVIDGQRVEIADTLRRLTVD